MVRPRVIETDEGIQGEFEVRTYDQMQRRFRDKGWMETKDILKSGITSGLVLEVGPGPGYLGLEWLKSTEGTTLKGLDISPDMIGIAERNAREYALTERAEYVQGNGEHIPFPDETFDAVFTNGSLHEWAQPKATFDEIWRILKPGAHYYISDLRRDIFVLLKWLMWLATKPKNLRSGLLSSINAAYTAGELEGLARDSRLENHSVNSNPIGLKLTGRKPG
jgi:ubiquinone/menaquinone biosynthesis C-methylase UbiE